MRYFPLPRLEKIEMSLVLKGLVKVHDTMNLKIALQCVLCISLNKMEPNSV